MRSFTFLRVSGALGQVGKDTQTMIQIVQLHIWNKIMLNSSVKAIWQSSYTCFSVFGRSGWFLGNWVQMKSKKVTEGVKLNISHQMRPYSKVKAIQAPSCTCFSVFGDLGQFGEIGTKYYKS